MVFGWHDTPWMWVSMVLFGSVIVILAFYAVKALSTGADAQSVPQPGEILAQRYARGELTAEEYREHCDALDLTRASRS